jgi:TRAP-type mannitol/chloroaromatic compound transport system permease large subunit
MNPLLATIIVLILMLFGTPVFVVIASLALYLFFSSQIDISAFIIEMHRMATTPVLVAIPLFTFAGYLLSESGAPRRLIRLSNAVLGWLPGGLSIIALVTCAVFTALTGATGLTIIAVGGMMINHFRHIGPSISPESSSDHLRDRGRSQDRSTVYCRYPAGNNAGCSALHI